MPAQQGDTTTRTHPWTARAGISLWRLAAAGLVSTALVAGVATPAGTTEGARFTSLERWLTEADDDGHGDDLTVMFSEVGVGSETVNVEVSAARSVSVTCVSAIGEFDVNQDEIISVRSADHSTGEEVGDPSVVVSSDDNGKVSGAAYLRTSPLDVCPEFHPGFDGNLGAKVHAWHDYAVSYRDLTVTDAANGGATASVAEPVTYRYEQLTGSTEGYIDLSSDL